MLKHFNPCPSLGFVSGGVCPTGILAGSSSQGPCKRPLMRCNRVKPRRRTTTTSKTHKGAALLQLLAKVLERLWTPFPNISCTLHEIFENFINTVTRSSYHDRGLLFKFSRKLFYLPSIIGSIMFCIFHIMCILWNSALSNFL